MREETRTFRWCVMARRSPSEAPPTRGRVKYQRGFGDFPVRPGVAVRACLCLCVRFELFYSEPAANICVPVFFPSFFPSLSPVFSTFPPRAPPRLTLPPSMALRSCLRRELIRFNDRPAIRFPDSTSSPSGEVVPAELVTFLFGGLC